MEEVEREGEMAARDAPRRTAERKDIMIEEE